LNTEPYADSSLLVSHRGSDVLSHARAFRRVSRKGRFDLPLSGDFVCAMSHGGRGAKAVAMRVLKAPAVRRRRAFHRTQPT